ncbi:hypothetical protein JCM10213_003996 [Rhodosporidiobolus nylandii]
MASNSSLKDLGAAALKRRATLASQGGGGLRAGSPNTLHNNRPLSRLSKSSLFDSELEGLAEPIQRDNTELDRINRENSIQRIIGDLQNDRISLSSASRSSASSRGSRSSAGEIEQERRRTFADEDDERRSESSSSSSRASSLGSFRIGLAAKNGTGGYDTDPLDPLDPPTEDDITYVTLPRSVQSPAASPAASPAHKSPAPGAPSPAQRPTGGMFGASPRHQQAASSPVRPSQRYGDENAPPAPLPSSAPPAAPFRRSPFTAAPSPAFPTVPARAAPPPSFIRSPYAPAVPQTQSARPSPLNPQVNSPVLGGSPTATYTGSGSGSRTTHRAGPSFSSPRPPPAEEEKSIFSTAESSFLAPTAAGGRSYALPNATVLTEALRSPLRTRPPARAAPVAQKASPLKSGSTANASATGSGKSAAADLVSKGITSLTSKLATLERENALSSQRVAELEAQLSRATSSATAVAQNVSKQKEDEMRDLKTEVERMLRDERERYAELESVVRSLRAQNTHLDAVLGQQHTDLESLRRERSVPAQPPVQGVAAGEELRVEMQDLKQGLEVLGYEVDGVRTVVEELLRDKEQREAAGRWEAEEEERRRTLAAAAKEKEADPDATPRPAKQNRGGAATHEAPGTPRSERSFVSDAEISRLRLEQELETARRTPKTRRHTAVRSSTPPPRPASAPVHHHHRHHQAQQTRPASSADESYSPSTATFDGESVSYSQESFDSEETYVADEEDASTLYEEPETLPPLPSHTKHRALKKHAQQDDEPDFGRAEQIFADVSRVTAHSHSHSPRRRRSATRGDRVVLVEEPSANLCANCHGRKRDLAAVEAEAKKARAREEKKEKAEREAREKEKKERKHRETLESVLDKLEEEFRVQKKIYLELTSTYQSMTSRSDSSKRRALANHLKKSVDMLEERAEEVKRYADALEALYEQMHHHACPPTSSGRKRHTA